MKTQLKIYKAIDSLDECTSCGKKISEKYHYVSYGIKYSMKKFHLTCFNKREEKKLIMIQKCINNFINDLKYIEEFKKRINSDTHDPICNPNKIRITINNNRRCQPKSCICARCDKDIPIGDAYIFSLSCKTKPYHIKCFINDSNKKLSGWNKYKTDTQKNINKLKPYHNEMICETLINN